MINLYNAFYPYFMYCNHIWESIYKANLLKLQILQNKAVRIATRSPLRSNTENVYKCSGIMKLDDSNTYLVGKFMYKVYQKVVPAIFDDFFMYNYHIHDNYTRTTNHLHVP